MRNFRIINNISYWTGSLLLVMLGLSQTAMAEKVSSPEEYLKADTLEDKSYNIDDSLEFAANEANLVFIRLIDNDSLQTSANIGIGGRFQVSLQPGYYSQVRYCSGQHNISVVPTGLKTNDLSHTNNYIVDFAPQQNHYIYVDIDDATGELKLSKLEPAYAQQLLSTQLLQTHQISRVIADCPPAVQAKPRPEPKVKVEIDKHINLEVLFEFDKAVIEPAFNHRIMAVANFLKKHSETSIAVIEGHTDNLGSDSYNNDLSKRRAEAVKQELVTKYGINPNRLQTQSYGETRPVDTNATAAGRHNNRRVIATVNASQ